MIFRAQASRVCLHQRCPCSVLPGSQLWVFGVGMWAGGELPLAGIFREVAGLQERVILLTSSLAGIHQATGLTLVFVCLFSFFVRTAYIA